MDDLILIARHLCKSYDGRMVVDGITFEVKRGECFGMLGPNGAGKSTTLRMIIGMTERDSGDLHLFGLDMDPEQVAVKARMGVVFQEDNLDDDLTVEENILVYASYFGMSRGRARERVGELLEFAQLTERRRDTVRKLSGGMKRRLVLARALVAQPELVVLDEPTTGLDPQARHVIWQRIRSLRENGVTILLTSHYMEEAQRLCDRILVLDGGKILDLDTPAALVERYVEPEVVEVRSATAEPLEPERFAPLPARLEEVDGTLHCYTRNASEVMALLCEHPGIALVRRPANLEDVFLQLTGRELRD
ncbi:MAG: ATP-binding cassette domain-containing protein [Magnetococcales bacterium]|nr:ATP-binding cassette domain-containing protein [Magnetococcales bacterium]NGZ25753.1 ATP-binding cassette domain-containing protein [Magnetococcales bacterium]